jgi:hypothetical protein
MFQGFPVEFLQFISSQNSCVRPGIVVEQNHISDWLTAPFGLVRGFHVVQKLAVVRSIHSTTFVQEVNEQYAFPVPKSGCENFQLADAFWPLQGNAPLSSATPYLLFLIWEYNNVPVTHHITIRCKKLFFSRLYRFRSPWQVPCRTCF